SCRTFAANAVQLQLHAFVFNLGNFPRTLATPKPIKDCERVGKTRTLMPVWDSSGESQLKTARAHREDRIPHRGNSAEMTATTASLGTAGPAPSNASLSGLDAVNLFLAGILAGFGPYLTAYLADQKWTQERIGFILTASSLAGLLSQLPGGELLDTVRS